MLATKWKSITMEELPTVGTSNIWKLSSSYQDTTFMNSILQEPAIWKCMDDLLVRTILPEDYANQYSSTLLPRVEALDKLSSRYLQDIDFSQKITDYYALTD